MFTSAKDTDLYMLYSLSNTELYNICHTNHYFKQLCTSDHTLNDKLAKHTAFIRATHFINAVESYMQNDPDPIQLDPDPIEFTLIHRREIVSKYPKLLPAEMQEDVKNSNGHYDLSFFGWWNEFYIEFDQFDKNDENVLKAYGIVISKDDMINFLSTYLYHYPKEYQELL